MIKISKLKKETKNNQKYGQKVIKVLKIKQKHGLKQKTNAKTKTKDKNIYL